MKIPSSILAIATALTGLGLCETHTVNNNTTYPADFRTFQEAHDGAVAGDTIILMPSGRNYGDVTVNKTLTLRGGQNVSSGARSEVGILSLNATAAGSLAEGIWANGAATLNGMNCVLKRCQALSLNIYQDSCTVESCHVGFFMHIGGEGPVGTVIRNTIFKVSSNSLESFLLGSLTVDHCVIDREHAGGNFNHIWGLATGMVSNSILTAGSMTAPYTLSFDHCLFLGSIPSTSSNGTAGPNSADTFVGNPTPPAGFPPGETSRYYELKVGSPALTGDDSGGQQGIFGGDTPFVHGFHPAVPRLTMLKKLSANPTTGITFRVQASSQE